jgi:hypothetical protein
MAPDIDFLYLAEARHFYSAGAKADIGINQRDVKRCSGSSTSSKRVRAFACKQEQLSILFSQTANALSPLYSSGAKDASDQVTLPTAGMIIEGPGTLQAFAHGARRWGGFEREGALPCAGT